MQHNGIVKRWKGGCLETEMEKSFSINNINIKRLGQVLRICRNHSARIALSWVPEGKHKRRRPTEKWRRTLQSGRIRLGFKSWAEEDQINGPILNKERTQYCIVLNVISLRCPGLSLAVVYALHN